MLGVGIGLEVLGILTILAAMALLVTGSGSWEHKVMEYFLCGSLVQNIGYLLEWTAGSQDTAITAIKMEYLGSTFIPLLYCWFLYSYCYRKPRTKLILSLALADIFMLPLVFTLERHTLFYREIEWIATVPGHGYLRLEYGLLYPIFLMCWMVIPYVLSLYVLIHTVVTRPAQGENRNYKAILLVSLLPVSTYIAYALKLIRGFDPTPLSLGIGLSLVVILIWNRRNYDFRHLASDVVLESIADGVIALDEQRRLIRCNPAAEGIFPKLEHCRIGERIPDQDGFWEKLLDDENTHTLRLDNRYYETHAKRITSESGKSQGYVLLVLDITETQNYINEIIEVRRQAEQASSAKSEFLANMSHEIRTPMNAIIGMSDIILEESRGLPIYSCAQDIQSAAKNLLNIINDILDLSKVEAGKMELVLSEYHLKGMVSSVVAMMDMAASQKGLLMKYEYDMSMPCRYLGDEGRIKQILINLLNNAVKFTKEGHVKITVSGQADGFGQELIVFRVEDTGCGIRKEDQSKIFEDFRQVDSKRNRSVEGTGLGLAITKHLVQMMKGSIELESVYGKGSVFTVTIPQPIMDSRPLSEEPEDAPKEQAPAESFTAPGVKTLIVDDNTVNRKVARGFLKSYEMELTEAASGPEAIELVKRTAFDLIFMDHMMPGMDGIEAVEHIRKECGANGTEAVIIALTANAMQGVREKFLSCGFQDFLPKPLGRKPLDDILLKWIPAQRRKVKKEDEALLPSGRSEAPVSESGSLQEASADASLPGLEGIDPKIVEEQYLGDEEEFRELLKLYCEEGGEKLGLLRRLAEAGDLKNYEIEAHGLKSASANIGARKLSEMAKEQEMAARREDRARIERDFPALLVTYEELLSHIRSYLNRGQGEPSETAEADGGNLRRQIKTALEQLEDFRSKECAETVKDLLRGPLDGGVKTRLEEIREQLALYEDDQAEELLRRLLEYLEEAS